MIETAASVHDLDARIASLLSPSPRIGIIVSENTTVAPEIWRVLSRRTPLPKLFKLSERDGQHALGEYKKYGEFLDDILAYKPDFIFTANRHGANGSVPLHLFCELWRIPIVHWYVDTPFFLDVHDYECEMDMLVNFVNCPDWVAPLRRAGMNKVHFLPMGASPDRFCPLDPDSRPLPVVFVGTHGLEKRRVFTTPIKDSFQGTWPLFKEKAAAYLKRGVEWLEANPGGAIQDWMDEQKKTGEFIAVFFADDSMRRNVGNWLDLEATTPSRIAVVDALNEFGIHVWGPDQWLGTVPRERFHGRIHYSEVHEVYRQAKIVVNVSRNQSMTVADQRHFDGASAGAVVATEDMAGQREFFDDSEMIFYSDLDDLKKKVGEVLADDSKRRDMADRARAKVLTNHTYDRRVAEIERIVMETRFSAATKKKPAFDEFAYMWIEKLCGLGESAVAARLLERMRSCNYAGTSRAGRLIGLYTGVETSAEADDFLQKEDRAACHWIAALSAMCSNNLGGAVTHLGNAVLAHPRNERYARFFGILKKAVDEGDLGETDK